MQLIYLPFGCRFGGTLFSIEGLAYRENNEPLDKTFIYEYNDIGNITLVKAYDFSLSVEPEGDCTPTTYEYDTTYPDRLISFNGNAITYNAQGYPTLYKGKNYNWSRGRLTKINIGSSMQTGEPCDECIFTYDAYGQRTKKNYVCDANPGVSGDDSYRCDTTYQYDQSGRLIREFITERDAQNVEVTRDFTYLYDECGIVGVMYSANGSTPQPYYYHRNLQGDVIAIYNTSGDKIVEYAYDAWGNCTIVYAEDLGFANANPIRYRGYYFDRETGLYYLNARYYNPEWRRFISPDAAEYIDPETPNGLNLYLYCNNDPVNYIDQSGHNRDGFFFQYVISYLMYIGIAVASIFDESIRNDMKAIEWNPFNSDEDLVCKSNKVSFYKGVPIVRAKSPNSSAGSFGVILLPRTGLYGVSNTYWSLEDLIRHEWGHSVQLITYGPIPYLIYIAIPSVLYNYDDTPWEITASALGGANRKYDEKDLQRGWNYFFFGKFVSSLWLW